MKYDLKDHPRSYYNTFMPKLFKHICLRTDFDKKKIVWMLISWRHNIWHEMSISCDGKVLLFFNFRTFWPNYNLDLRFYGPLLSLFYLKSGLIQYLENLLHTGFVQSIWTYNIPIYNVYIVQSTKMILIHPKSEIFGGPSNCHIVIALFLLLKGVAKS